MKINNCFKGFNSGIGKVISPKQTCDIVLKRFKTLSPLIMDRYFEVKRPNGIPQYRVEGTAYYRDLVGSPGQNGKGHYKQQALASALMELAERYSCVRWKLDKKNICKIASFKELKKNLFTIDDFYSEFNKDFVELLKNIGMDSIKIEWNKSYTLDGKPVYLPFLLWRLFGSNGMAAGNSLEEALLHGICELIERNQQTTVENNKIETPTIDVSKTTSPIVLRLLKKFSVFKNQRLMFKDFSLKMGLPVIGLIRTMGDGTCTLSTGVATTAEEALIRALTENSQSEGNQEVTINQSLIKYHFANKEVIPIESISSINNYNIKTEIKTINKLLLKKNMRVFFMDVTDNILNVDSVIVHIPGAKNFSFDIDGMSNKSLISYFLQYFLQSGNYIAFDRCLNSALEEKLINKTEKEHLLRRVFLKNKLR